LEAATAVESSFKLATLASINVRQIIGPKSRLERPSKTKIGTQVAHITGELDNTFRVKGHGHQATGVRMLDTSLKCTLAPALV